MDPHRIVLQVHPAKPIFNRAAPATERWEWDMHAVDHLGRAAASPPHWEALGFEVTTFATEDEARKDADRAAERLRAWGWTPWTVDNKPWPTA